MLHANTKGADQPAHPCSLISSFVVCSLQSISKLVSYTISLFFLVYVAEQPGLSLTWSEAPKTGFLAIQPIYTELILLFLEKYLTGMYKFHALLYAYGCKNFYCCIIVLEFYKGIKGKDISCNSFLLYHSSLITQPIMDLKQMLQGIS